MSSRDDADMQAMGFRSHEEVARYDQEQAALSRQSVAPDIAAIIEAIDDNDLPAVRRMLEMLPAPQSVVVDAKLPKWIDDAKGKDPFTDDLIHYIEQLRAAPAGDAVAVVQPFDETFALELAHDCGIRYQGDAPTESDDDKVVAYAKAVLAHFQAHPAPAAQAAPSELQVSLA